VSRPVGTDASIHVLAGTNGAGKSSVAGAALRALGSEYYNPDEAARVLRMEDPALTQERANALAWAHGADRLVRAIRERREYAFETTLGGRTIIGLLESASHAGLAVRVTYVGLRDADLHVARVRSRVTFGGHDIPEETIRRRYDRSIENLVRLLPVLTECVVWDNSAEGDPMQGIAPAPRRLLHYRAGRLLDAVSPSEVPEWAKPVYLTAYELANPGL
jgi:predicted ABC-type ATPase